jgi:hypothetical protein
VRNYDVSPDGQRFLLLQTGGGADGPVAPDLVLVQNWLEELKRLVPTQ